MLPRPLCPLIAVAALALVTAPVAAVSAQQWNTPAALELVGRGVARRLAAQADSSLASYRTRAHGFVLFLAQVGQEGLNEAPHLVKGDELDVEVYWKAPNRSKQVILGWRDGSFLPNETNYHRDHLGIVTNNFGNVIRIGEGDEVRDAVHPLSPAGLTLYDYAIQDSLSIRNGTRQVTVRAVAVRPRSFSRPLVVGTLYLDATTAELVRFRFSFTPAAYIDRDLEDISITLENGLYEQRYWLQLAQGKMLFPQLNEIYAYGAPMSTPSLMEMLDIWHTVTKAVDPYLDTLTTETLQIDLLRDGKSVGQSLGSALRRITYHYWYHIGEIQAMRQMLGHAGLPEYVGNIETEAPYRPE